MQIRKGEVYNFARASQLRDYSGLLIGNITPTDIDGLIEYKNIAYVIIELKYGDTELPYGQRLALERLTDDLQRSGKITICIIITHRTPSDEIIDVANSDVKEYRYNGKWVLLNYKLTSVDMIQGFIKKLPDNPQQNPLISFNY